MGLTSSHDVTAWAGRYQPAGIPPNPIFWLRARAVRPAQRRRPLSGAARSAALPAQALGSKGMPAGSAFSRW